MTGWENLPITQAVIERCKILERLYSSLEQPLPLGLSSVDQEFIDLFTNTVRCRVLVIVNKASRREHIKNAFMLAGESLPELISKEIESQKSVPLKKYGPLHKDEDRRRFRTLLPAQETSLQKIEIQFNSLNGLMSQNVQTTSQVWRAVQSVQRQHILDWIHPSPHWQIHERQRPDQGSCNWLLDPDTFRSWSISVDGNTFWLCGKMNVGKSNLAHAVIEYWIHDSKTSIGAVAYTYHNADLDVDTSLHLLVKQLSTLRNDDEIPDFIVNTYEASGDKRPPSSTTCQAWLHEVSSAHIPVRIVIDGLDKFPAPGLDRLLHYLSIWLEGNPAQRQLIVTSRGWTDIYESIVTAEVDQIGCGRS